MSSDQNVLFETYKSDFPDSFDDVNDQLLVARGRSDAPVAWPGDGHLADRAFDMAVRLSLVPILNNCQERAHVDHLSSRQCKIRPF